MNLIHLKYAIEVEKTRSITKAAENLFMGQPNLSRAIRELEQNIGIQIFKRTSRGVIPTAQGKEFLGYAKNILEQVEKIESLYHPAQSDKLLFSVSCPSAGYIAYAFIKTAEKLDLSKAIEFNFTEAGNMDVIKNVSEGNCGLGILRYPSSQEKHIIKMLAERKLSMKPIWEFQYQVLMSDSNPLAHKMDITCTDLKDFVEIANGDLNIPSLQNPDIKQANHHDIINRRISVTGIGSLFNLVSTIPNTFMWDSANPSEFINRYSLVEKSCKEATMKYRDILIFKNDYQFSKLDKMFVEELENAKNEALYKILKNN
ncbi:MAG TPA: LysR family transcriptional regulator [Clostridiaceae bacterium]|nr:LysR family transcriptional regulator [Clostridiaceae bacterium]